MVGCLLVSEQRPTVGDTVRVTTNYYQESLPMGTIVTIDEDDRTNLPYCVKKDGSVFWFRASEVELVQEEEKASGEDEDYLVRYFDEYVDDRDTLNALQAMGIDITEKEYAAALEIASSIYKVREARKNG